MEDLLILSEKRSQALRSQIVGNRLHIVQEASPRVVVVEGERDRLDAVARQPGVTSASDHLRRRDEAALASPDLDTGERLFVKAWLSRQRGTVKERVGDGLPWDSPGFSAP